MTAERNVWVFIEQDEQQFAEVSLELLGEGQRICRPARQRSVGNFMRLQGSLT